MIGIEYAYQRFCDERFPLPSEAQLEALEQRIGITFPEDYRQFVLEFNGGYFTGPDITPVGDDCPQDGLRCLCGIGASHEESELATELYLSLFDGNDPPIIVPIGRTEMGGLIILITEEENRGCVLLKQAYGEFFYLADGIEEFFELLREPVDD